MPVRGHWLRALGGYIAYGVTALLTFVSLVTFGAPPTIVTLLLILVVASVGTRFGRGIKFLTWLRNASVYMSIGAIGITGVATFGAAGTIAALTILLVLASAIARLRQQRKFLWWLPGLSRGSWRRVALASCAYVAITVVVSVSLGEGRSRIGLMILAITLLVMTASTAWSQRPSLPTWTVVTLIIGGAGCLLISGIDFLVAATTASSLILTLLYVNWLLDSPRLRLKTSAKNAGIAVGVLVLVALLVGQSAEPIPLAAEAGPFVNVTITVLADNLDAAKFTINETMDFIEPASEVAPIPLHPESVVSEGFLLTSVQLPRLSGQEVEVSHASRRVRYTLCEFGIPSYCPNVKLILLDFPNKTIHAVSGSGDAPKLSKDGREVLTTNIDGYTAGTGISFDYVSASAVWLRPQIDPVLGLRTLNDWVIAGLGLLVGAVSWILSFALHNIAGFFAGWLGQSLRMRGPAKSATAALKQPQSSKEKAHRPR